jgi:hypothetical protein
VSVITDQIEPLVPGDPRALSVSFWNDIVDTVNHLRALNAGEGASVYKADANVIVDLQERVPTIDDGLVGLDPEVSDFIHVGTGVHHPFGSHLWGTQPIRDWRIAGTPVYGTVNEVGQWDWWHPNGRPDYVWRCRLKLPFPFTIRRIELYQVRPNPITGIPFWGSGQMWSTLKEVYPFQYQPGDNPHVDPNGLFNAYPLQVYRDGSMLGHGTRVNFDYSAYLDSNVYQADTNNTLYMSGDAQQPVPVGEFFRAMFFITDASSGVDYRVIRGTIGSAPVNPPTEL